MRNNILIYGRFLFALIVFGLSIMAFIKSFYPFKIFDLQFSALLQSGIISGFGISMILLLLILITTLIFGRIYCSLLCPLGIYQEILTILFTPFYKKYKFNHSKHYIFAYFLASVLFGLLFGKTIVALSLIDPYSVFGNALSKAWYGLGFIFGLTILVLFFKRFFCTNICPVGAVLGFISRFSLFKIRIDEDKCKICGLCAKTCPCGSIDFKNNTVNNETCVKCFKCLKHCNHSALYYGTPKSKPQKTEFNPKRRQFITLGLVALTFGVAFKGGLELTKKIASKIKNVILPAGGKNVKDFANRCLNCNLCVKNCPNKIIKPASKEIPFVHIEYNMSSCRFDCNKCSTVCPSGAIKRLTLQEKQNIKIANAVINKDICIQCGVCVMECPKKIITKDYGKSPVIEFDKCIGCGKCASVCPVGAISIDPISKQVTLN